MSDDPSSRAQESSRALINQIKDVNQRGFQLKDLLDIAQLLTVDHHKGDTKCNGMNGINKNIKDNYQNY